MWVARTTIAALAMSGCVVVLSEDGDTGDTWDPLEVCRQQRAPTVEPWRRDDDPPDPWPVVSANLRGLDGVHVPAVRFVAGDGTTREAVRDDPDPLAEHVVFTLDAPLPATRTWRGEIDVGCETPLEIGIWEAWSPGDLVAGSVWRLVRPDTVREASSRTGLGGPLTRVFDAPASPFALDDVVIAVRSVDGDVATVALGAVLSDDPLEVACATTVDVAASGAAWSGRFGPAAWGTVDVLGGELAFVADDAAPGLFSVQLTLDMTVEEAVRAFEVVGGVQVRDGGRPCDLVDTIFDVTCAPCAASDAGCVQPRYVGAAFGPSTFDLASWDAAGGAVCP